jgi:hypothetical protein
MLIQKDIDYRGRLVYLTKYLEKWFTDINPAFDVPITNRIAKIVKVFDWDTEEGKLLLEMRKKTGKWEKVNPEEFKFVVKIYYPDLIFKNKNKVMIEEVVPRLYPGTKLEMFCLLPEWMLKDLIKEEKDVFKVIKKD